MEADVPLLLHHGYLISGIKVRHCVTRQLRKQWVIGGDLGRKRSVLRATLLNLFGYSDAACRRKYCVGVGGY